MKRPACPRKLKAPAALLFCLTALLSPGLNADVLVLRDGTQLETVGPWEVKGRQIVFKTAAGTLSALRLAEVDLPGSEKATAEALAPKKEEAKPEVKKQPVLVLTDKDVAKASPDFLAAVAQNDGNAAVAGQAGAGTGSGKVEVTSSSMESASGDEFAFLIRGIVRNNSAATVGRIKVLATATVSRNGANRLVLCEAEPASSELGPQGESEFSCSIRRQDVLSTGMAEAFRDAALSFEVRSSPKTAAEPEPDEQSESEP